jgi:major membrane immunogen (membrane-anchored lipoprotein)
MRKIYVAVIALLLPLMLFSGCDYNPLNDSESGEIVIGELKAPFVNGVYYGYGAYFNNDGYCAVMKISVNNNMITAVNFDYVDGQMRRYTEYASAEDVQSFKTTVKNLTGIIIADQDYMRIRNLASDKTSKDYLALIVLIFPNLKTGDTTVSALKQIESYDASGNSLYFGYRPALTVEYLGDTISMINFSLADENGGAFDASEAADGMLPKDSDYTYAKIIQNINAVPDDKTTLNKNAPSGEWTFLFNIYNSLTYSIEKKHVPANIDVTAVF